MFPSLSVFLAFYFLFPLSLLRVTRGDPCPSRLMRDRFRDAYFFLVSARTHARHFRHSLFPSFFIDTPYAPNGRCNTRTKMKRKKKKRKKKRTTRPKGRVGVGRDRNLTTRSLEGLAPKTVWLSSVSVTRREEGKVVGWVGGWVGRSVESSPR